MSDLKLPHDLPELSKDALVEMSGWTVYREGRALHEAGQVTEVSWKHPLLTGRVGEGPGSQNVALNLRSITFAENRCGCPTGRRGQICAHAIALCIAVQKGALTQKPEAPAASLKAVASSAQPEEKKSEEASGLKLRSIRADALAEKSLRLRLLLPPNLESSAQRNAIMIKIELIADRTMLSPEKVLRGSRYSVPEKHYAALAFLEDLSGGRLFSLVQLKNSQLLELLKMFEPEPFVYPLQRPDVPLTWGWIEANVRACLRTAVPEPVKTASVEVRRRGNVPIRRQRTAAELLAERRHENPIPDNKMVVDGSPHFLSVRLPVKDHPLYRRAVEMLRAEGFRPEPSNGRWWLRDAHKVLNFLATKKRDLDAVYDPVWTDNYKERMGGVCHLEITCRTEDTGNGFVVTLELSAKGVTESDIRSALASNCYYVRQTEAIWLIDPGKLEKLQNSMASLSGEANRPLAPLFQTKVGSAGLVDAERILADLEEDLVLPDTWKKQSRALKEVGSLERPELPGEFDNLLRGYQRIGVAWLWHLYRNGLGGILADEMGLGKTIQALGLIHCVVHQTEEHTEGKPNRALVVAPAGLVGNWLREVRRFLPSLRVFVHHRESRIENLNTFNDWDLVVTSYTTLSRDEELFQQAGFALIIADEAQHIKNRQTQASRSLRGLEGSGRFVLTGTPIENSVEDLRSIFAFCLPGYLARRPVGAKGEEKNWYDRRNLEQAAPYILRRSKQLVAPDLPEKIEQVIYCEMEPAQRSVYDKVQVASAKAIQDMEFAGVSENKIRFAALTELLRLRQVSADPGTIDEDFPIEQSAKLQAFREILDEALDGGHRILVFSQFVRLLKRLRTWLGENGVACSYLDGTTTDRLAECDRFNNDPEIPVFLISLKAGGTGLNLTGADTVVFFDPWWNPAVEDQATDRAHRIGQKKIVTSYKLIVSGTVEEKVRTLQEQKAQLLRELLDESSARTDQVSLADLKELMMG